MHACAYSNVVDEHGTARSTTADRKNELYNTNHWGNDFIVDGEKELDLWRWSKMR